MAGDFKKESEEKVVGKSTNHLATKPDTIISSSLTAAGLFSKCSGRTFSAPTVKNLLEAIAYGEQDKAKALLEENRNLLLEADDVKDAANRCFKKITGFQLAVWQLDQHMWKMIQSYLPSDQAAKQFKELENNGTDHGLHFDLSPMIEALEAYIEMYENPSSDLDACSREWCKKVGAKQALLVPHVINEYCRPDRSFFSIPDFEKSPLPRTRRVFADWDKEQDWYTLVFKKGKLGETFAYERGENDTVMMRSLSEGVEQVKRDLDALKQLYSVRKQQYQSLRNELLGQITSESKEEAIKRNFDAH